jgi:hypothetical protein
MMRWGKAHFKARAVHDDLYVPSDTRILTRATVTQLPRNKRDRLVNLLILLFPSTMFPTKRTAPPPRIERLHLVPI